MTADGVRLAGAFIMTFIAGVLAAVLWDTRPTFGPNQTPQVIAQRYQRCKDSAPKGMDCTLVAMMVSEEVARELGKRP